MPIATLPPIADAKKNALIAAIAPVAVKRPSKKKTKKLTKTQQRRIAERIAADPTLANPCLHVRDVATRIRDGSDMTLDHIGWCLRYDPPLAYRCGRIVAEVERIVVAYRDAHGLPRGNWAAKALGEFGTHPNRFKHTYLFDRFDGVEFPKLGPIFDWRDRHRPELEVDSDIFVRCPNVADDRWRALLLSGYLDEVERYRRATQKKEKSPR